jgi:hypothetical protein
MAGRVLLFASVVCLALGSARAHAADEWKRNSTVWTASDRCARAAFKQFPDYTPESNAKRDHAVQLCLASGNLPPRASTEPPPPPPAADQQPH